MPAALVIDLDGVLRRWDPQLMTDIERRHGLPSGAVLATAFREHRLQAAITGRLPDARWRADIAAELGRDHAAAGAAVAEWSASSGDVDAAVLDIVRRQRSQRTVALATNATDRLAADLATLGLDGDFDAVFNSAEMGMAKPDPRVFAHIADTLGVPAAGCVFVDDTAANVAAAARAGFTAHQYRSPGELAEFLAAV